MLSVAHSRWEEHLPSKDNTHCTMQTEQMKEHLSLASFRELSQVKLNEEEQ